MIKRPLMRLGVGGSYAPTLPSAGAEGLTIAESVGRSMAEKLPDETIAIEQGTVGDAAAGSSAQGVKNFRMTIPRTAARAATGSDE